MFAFALNLDCADFPDEATERESVLGAENECAVFCKVRDILRNPGLKNAHYFGKSRWVQGGGIETNLWPENSLRTGSSRGKKEGEKRRTALNSE